MVNYAGNRAVKAGDHILPIVWVEDIDISTLEEHQYVTIRTYKGDEYKSYGFDAIETVMIYKPSALEGRRLKWKKGSWRFHNFIIHPLLEILSTLGFKRLAVRLHDWGTPMPRGFKND